MTRGMSVLEELDRGWSWVVLAATFGYFLVFGMFLYGVGIAHMALLEEYSAKSATTALAGGLYAALVSLGGPLSSYIIDRFSCRIALFVDGFLTTVGCLSTAFSPNIFVCIVTYGVVAGIGSGIGYTATMVVVGFNFRTLRNLATGIAVSGVGIGTFAFSPAIQALRSHYGYSGYFIIMAGIGLQKCVFAALCKPSSLEIQRQIRIKEDDNVGRPSRREILRHYATVYTNKAIICFSFSLFMFSVGTYMIFLFLPSYSVSRGYSPMQASWLLSVCGLFTVGSRILASMVTSKQNVDELVMYSGLFGTLALGSFLFPLYSKTYAGQVVFSMLLGIYFGGCYAIMNSINIKVVGVKYLSIATGMELIFCGIGTAVGPVITGTIIDSGGTYEQSFMVAAFCILLGAALGMATVLFQPDDLSPASDFDVIVTKDGDVTMDENPVPGNSSLEIKELQCNNPRERKCVKRSVTKHTAEVKPNTSYASSPAIVRAHIQEPVNFSEEIQKLLKGEELKFIDES